MASMSYQEQKHFDLTLARLLRLLATRFSKQSSEYTVLTLSAESLEQFYQD